MLSSRTFCVDDLHLPFSCERPVFGVSMGHSRYPVRVLPVVGWDRNVSQLPWVVLSLVTVLFQVPWELVLHVRSLVFGHRLKETPFQASGACYLHSSSCPVLSSAKAKCWTLPELQSPCPQLCEPSCSAWLPCSALGFGNCFQESWAIIGFTLFLPPSSQGSMSCTSCSHTEDPAL